MDWQNLRTHYSYFLNQHNDHILLTGHSHQAWPDATRFAQVQAWDDAAQYIDEKWSLVFDRIIPAFQNHIAKRIGENNPSLIATGQSTLEFLYRLLSCFPIDRSLKIVTTTSEFHSLARVLSRIEEEGVSIERVPTDERDTLTDRIIEAIDRNTKIVMLSMVFFDTGAVLQRVDEICQRAREVGAKVYLDSYHAFNVVPFDIHRFGEQVFITGGGYKYTQSGEGAAWMRIPPDCALRPSYTGWFADFDGLEKEDVTKHISYSNDGMRFAGATFDPTPFYRANAAFDFMNSLGLTTEVLHQRSLHLTQCIIDLFDSLELESLGMKLATPRNADERGGFISLVHPRANDLRIKLREKRVWTDARGHCLRLGPAPFVLEEEIEDAMKILQELLVSMQRD